MNFKYEIMNIHIYNSLDKVCLDFEVALFRKVLSTFRGITALQAVSIANFAIKCLPPI